jgi:hypothetical protein
MSAQQLVHEIFAYGLLWPVVQSGLASNIVAVMYMIVSSARCSGLVYKEVWPAVMEEAQEERPVVTE